MTEQFAITIQAPRDEGLRTVFVTVRAVIAALLAEGVPASVRIERR